MKRKPFNHSTLFFSAILLMLIYSSCSYKQDQVLFQKGTGPSANSMTSLASTIAYRIQPQDILQIQNMQDIKYIVSDKADAQASTSSSSAEVQTYQVEEDSTVGLPVLGNVKVAGLTRFEAEKKLTGLYANTLLKNPIIKVKIMNLKVTVMGEVKTPGNYPLIDDKTTLTEVLGEAGGLTTKADEKTIKIIRGDPQNPQVTEIDLSLLTSLSNPACVMRNKDIIYVAESRHAIKNEKLQNFATQVQPALTLLNTILIIFTLSKN